MACCGVQVNKVVKVRLCHLAEEFRRLAKCGKRGLPLDNLLLHMNEGMGTELSSVPCLDAVGAELGAY